MFKPPQQPTSTRTLHLSFMASTVIYGIVAYLLKTQVMLDDPGFVGLDEATYTLLLTGAIGISMILAVVALVLLPQASWRERIMARLARPADDTPAAKAQAYHILRVAMIETIAILGLCLFFFNGNLTHLWWFLGGASALLIVLFPLVRSDKMAHISLHKPIALFMLILAAAVVLTSAGGAGSASAAGLGETAAGTTRFNFIAIALDASASISPFKASGLAAYHGSSVKQVLNWNAATQQMISYAPGISPPFADFNLAVGGAYFLALDSTSVDSLSLVGTVPDQGTVSFSMAKGLTPASCKFNAISLPLAACRRERGFAEFWKNQAAIWTERSVSWDDLAVLWAE